MKHYDLARAEIGTFEWKDGHNPKVIEYFAEVGHSWVTDDETAWCAAFVGAMLERSGIASTRKLNARSYLDWGVLVKLEAAEPGDVVIFSRGDPKGWQGHVAFFVKENATTLTVLGGNQSNQVIEARYPKDQLLGIRRPLIAKPFEPAAKWHETPHSVPNVTQSGWLAALIAAVVALFRKG